MLKCPIVMTAAVENRPFLDDRTIQEALHDRPPSVVRQLDKALRVYESDSLIRITTDIIDGLAQGDRWDELGQDTALFVLSRIPFLRIGKDSWDGIYDQYVSSLHAVRVNENRSNPLYNLVDAGTTLAPYFGATITNLEGVFSEFAALHTVTDLEEGQAVTPVKNTKLEDMQTALTLVSIETNTRQGGKNNINYTFEYYYLNPEISVAEITDKIHGRQSDNKAQERIKQRQLVYLYRDRDVEAVAAELAVPIGRVYATREWLKSQHYPITEKKRGQKVPPEVEKRRDTIFLLRDREKDDIVATTGINRTTVTKDLRVFKKRDMYRERTGNKKKVA